MQDQSEQLKNNNILYIWTDGSCLRNPGPGGWAAILQYNDHKKTISGGVKDTTNNQMELLAAIKSLEKIKNERNTDKIHIFSDSKYVIQGITSWITSWKKNNWKNSNKKSIKNKDLWQTLDSLNAELSVNWQWIKAHSGNIYNEMADSLAREAASKRIINNV